MEKLKTMWSLIKARHYALLLGDEQEIAWAMETLKKADDRTNLGIEKGKKDE